MLRNREEQEQIRIKGIDLVDEDIELGYFTSLQNWIPTNSFSLKRKRGVVAFTSAAITPTVPSAC